MMKKLRSRLLSIILAYAFLLSTIPTIAFAYDDEAGNTTTLDISAGAITIHGTQAEQNGNTYTINDDTRLIITGTSDTYNISVDTSTQVAAFTIKDLHLTTSNGSSLINIAGSEAALTLEGENSLTGGGMGLTDNALIRVPKDSTLTIDGSGSLKLNNGTASAAAHGAAIGGSAAEDAGTINIVGGTINIKQYGPGAGIGGGGPDASSCTGNSGNISISGGNVTIRVTAVDNYGGGCGIGPGINHYTVPASGHDGILNTIVISGGTVNIKTTSISDSDNNYSGAAIGAGRIGAQNGMQSKIHITGNANVTAVSDFAAAIGGSPARVVNGNMPQDEYGTVAIQIDGNAIINASTPYTGAYYYSGAAIGQACYNMITEFNINIGGNAQVTAEGGYTGAGIGGSYTYSRSAVLDISIKDNAKVYASSLFYCAGIGSGYSINDTSARTTINICDGADVFAHGGDYYAGAGIGAGYQDNSGNITITDRAKVTAVGGVTYPGWTIGASAIGAGGNGKVAGTITITEGTTIEAYADGTKFAIDTDLRSSGALNVSDTVLNGRFAEDENPPTDNDADPSPINLLKDGDIDAELELPDDYRSFAVTASDGAGTIRVQNAANLNRYAYFVDDEDNKQINYPLYNEVSEGVYEMLTKDNLRWMPVVELKPADITIYTGGNSYDGVVDSAGNIETDSSGLPEAGFYVTLPEDLNNELKDALDKDQNEALDLSPYLTFHSGSKIWTLEPYDGAETSAVTGDDGIERYIYRLKAGTDQDPVRMQFTDASGNVQVSDVFDLENALYSEYNMSIYPGAVDQNTVYAKIDTDKITENGGDPSTLSYTTYAASSTSGKLTIRGVTQQGASSPVVETVTEPVKTITATAPEDTEYYVNSSKVKVVNGNPSLLVDAIVHTEESDKLLTEKALEALNLTASNDLRYDFRYLDLVDANNGNTWITASNPVTVYWNYPEGTDQNTTFYLVHFEGLDREMNVTDLTDKINNAKITAITPTVGENGIVFETDSFSPYVLVWETTSSGGGGGGTTYYTLHYESNGGTEYADESYASGTTVQLTKVPTREGYTFIGWYADAALTKPVTEIKMTAKATVYAGWEITEVPDWLNGDDHFAYVIGYEDGTVRPLSNITRAEVATIFFRLLNEDVRAENLTETNVFTDVSADDWYNTAVSTMASLGIIKGRTETTFEPDAPITRAEFAAICARFDTGRTDGDSNFTDLSGHWAKDEIERAATLGWITGYPDGTFRPENAITRAEAMTMINRVLQRLPENESDLLSNMQTWPDNLSSAWYYLAVQEATNSHDFDRKADGVHEKWTALTANPNWTEFQ